eukprot:m51a1_g13069 putative serine threonine-protein kinase ctr1-like (204) ;mRNA; f:275-1110
MQTAKDLRCPCIALIHGAVTTGSRFCYVTENVPFGTLGDFIKSGEEISESLKYKMALDISTGMQALHGAGLCASLCPSAIGVFSKLPQPLIVTAKVVEFGHYSKVLSTDKQQAFNAPEVLQGGPVTKASDVYNFGLILLFLETRKDPLEGLTQAQALDAITGGKIQIPACQMQELIAGLLLLDPAQRPAFPDITPVLSSLYTS